MARAARECKGFGEAARAAAAGAGVGGRARVRLMAVADVLDGKPVREAAEEAGCAAREVERWMWQFIRAGVKALRERREVGQPRRLSAAQDEELVALLLADRECGIAELRDIAEARFGVRYSASGMKHHAEKVLGFRWVGGRVMRRRPRV